MLSYFKKWLPGSSAPKSHNQQFGRIGENYAVNHLKQNNYGIIQTNYRTPAGEIDIIAHEGATVVFIEVKTREETQSYGRPAEAVTREKQRRIRKIAQIYLNSHKGLNWKEYRFDVIEVIVNQNVNLIELNQIKNAF